MKVTKRELTEASNMLKWAITDSHRCIHIDEYKQSLKFIQKHGRNLIAVMEKDLNVHAKRMVPECEAQIDQSFHYIQCIQKKIAQLEAPPISEPHPTIH